MFCNKVLSFRNHHHANLKGVFIKTAMVLLFYFTAGSSQGSCLWALPAACLPTPLAPPLQSQARAPCPTDPPLMLYTAWPWAGACQSFHTILPPSCFHVQPFPGTRCTPAAGRGLLGLHPAAVRIPMLLQGCTTWNAAGWH